MKEENAALCRALSSLTGISVSPIYPDSPEQFYEEACAARFCRQCPYQQKNEFNTHLYGLSEAYRWDGHFIYYCPKAMVFVAAAILDSSGSLGGGMIAGPIVMGDIQDITCYTEYPYSRSTIEQLPRMTTLQVRQLALLLSAAASSLHHGSFEQKRSYDQQQFLNAIYDMRSKYMDEKEHYGYILSAENQVLRGFPLTCSSINVSADQPCRLSGYKGSSVSILPYHLITGRKVHDHMSTCLCVGYTWRLRNPKVLTNLCCYCQFFTLITHKQQVCTKGNLNAVYLMSVHTVTA